MDWKGDVATWSFSDWQAVFKAVGNACRKLGRFIIEVRPWDAAKEISLQQMAYIHCDAGPIKLFAEFQAVDADTAELDLKRKCSRHLFVQKATLKNLHKCKHGEFRFECTRSECDKLCWPHQALHVNGKYICPTCSHPSLQLIHIKTKTGFTVKQANEWIESMIGFCESHGIHCLPPDKNWRENKD